MNIYKLDNFGGSSWGEDMPSRFIGDPQETAKILTFEIDGNGNSSLLGINDNLLTTKPSVGVEGESSVPSMYSLGQNYPNPFNSNTTIKFSVETLHATSLLQLNIYDINGKIIDEIPINVTAPGLYTVDWNSSENPSGIYIYQLVIDSQIMATKKMLLLR